MSGVVWAWMLEVTEEDLAQPGILTRAFDIFGAGFAPGKTPPGHSLETEGVKVIFRSVNSSNEAMAELLEIANWLIGFDWSQATSLVMEATAQSSDLAELERRVRAGVADWLGSFRCHVNIILHKPNFLLQRVGPPRRAGDRGPHPLPHGGAAPHVGPLVRGPRGDAHRAQGI
jgi:hypothetical protein